MAEASDGTVRRLYCNSVRCSALDFNLDVRHFAGS